jgi:hypothetical protein
MFNEIEYLQKFDAGEYAYYVRDGKRLDPPETNVGDKERYAGDIVPIV